VWIIIGAQYVVPLIIWALSFIKKKKNVKMGIGRNGKQLKSGQTEIKNDMKPNKKSGGKYAKV
jgi:hypothetical protein